jgi:regulator of replication initiation timing
VDINRLNELLVELRRNHLDIQQKLLLVESQKNQYLISIERLEKEKKLDEQHKDYISDRLESKTKELFESKTQMQKQINELVTMLDNCNEDISSLVSRNSKLKTDLTVTEDQLEEKLKELQALSNRYVVDTSKLMEEKASQEQLILLSQVLNLFYFYVVFRRVLRSRQNQISNCF